MLPNVYADDLTQDFTIVALPTRTYRLNFDGRPSAGMLDGLEAMKQMIYLTLSCERYRYEIFSYNYGVELDGRIGEQNDGILRLKIRDAITDALIYDDRVTEVSDFSFSQDGKKLAVSFTVKTTQGDVASELDWWGSEWEVNVWDTATR